MSSVIPGEMRISNPTRNAAIPTIMTSHQGIVATCVVSVVDEKRGSMFISYALITVWSAARLLSPPTIHVHDLASETIFASRTLTD